MHEQQSLFFFVKAAAVKDSYDQIVLRNTYVGTVILVHHSKSYKLAHDSRTCRAVFAVEYLCSAEGSAMFLAFFACIHMCSLF